MFFLCRCGSSSARSRRPCRWAGRWRRRSRGRAAAASFCAGAAWTPSSKLQSTISRVPRALELLAVAVDVASDLVVADAANHAAPAGRVWRSLMTRTRAYWHERCFGRCAGLTGGATGGGDNIFVNRGFDTWDFIAILSFWPAPSQPQCCFSVC